MNLKEFVRDVPDFPLEGITFRDITPLLHSPCALAEVIRQMSDPWKGKIDIVAGLDARGFIFGTGIALELELPFMMIRKKGKLPGKVESLNYGLEYGENVIEVSLDSLPVGTNVLIVDDLLATGGTAQAAATLVKKIGLTVAGYAFVIELSELSGRQILNEHEITSVLTY